MEIKFNESEKLVEVIFEDVGKVFKFSLNTEVKLTEFVKYVSDFEKEIIITPENYEAFQAGNEIQSKESKKLIEYLYKIVNSFNESFQTVFETEKSS